MFYLIAIESNHDAVLVFEEPESHSFPGHTKQLAERIALDDQGNQYFISAHNPYFLYSIMEKTSPKELALFVVDNCDFETRIQKVPTDEYS